MHRGMREQGIDPDARLDRYIRLLNDCISSRPQDMNAGIHLCRGNTKDGFARGGYARIAAKLFQGVKANCFYVSLIRDNLQRCSQSSSILLYLA